MAEHGSQSILVIDDDQDIVQTIKGNLELDGYQVLCAFEGRKGIDMAREFNGSIGIFRPIRDDDIVVLLKPLYDEAGLGQILGNLFGQLHHHTYRNGVTGR